jgi:hypothetical protein
MFSLCTYVHYKCLSWINSKVKIRLKKTKHDCVDLCHFLHTFNFSCIGLKVGDKLKVYNLTSINMCDV